MLKIRRAIGQKSRGQASVEFILSVIFVMVVVFWAVEFIVLMYSYVVVSDAAKEGVRYAVVHGSGNSSPSGPGNDSAVKAAVTNYAGILSASDVTVTYSDGNNDPPGRVRVTISHAYSPIFILPWTPPTINASAEGRIAN